MANEQLKVVEIVARAVGKGLDIPEFQREFIWDPEQVKLLADSLYRDYPVGSFLLWDSAQYQESKSAAGTQFSLWIVDGQQRTTALCLLFGQKPYWWETAHDWNDALVRYDVYVNVLPDDPNGLLPFHLPNPVVRADPRWVSLRSILSVDHAGGLTSLAERIAANLPEQHGHAFTQIHANLQELWQIRSRDIVAVKVNHEVEDVAEIFARLNRAGTKVTEADVVLALAAVHNPGWVRSEYLPFRNDLADRGWDLEAGIYVRAMAAIGCGRARLKEAPKDFWTTQLADTWGRTRDTVAEVIHLLADRGISSVALLSSANSLIPLFALHERWKNRPGYTFARALRWLLLANRDGRYSGSAITTLNEDVRAILEANTCDDALDTLLSRLRVGDSIQPEEFLERYDRAGQRFLRLMVYLTMFHRRATDWVDETRIGYDNTGSPVTTGFEPQWHHIYPRAVLRDAGRPADDIHALANITVLNEGTNVRRLSAKPPARYIEQFRITAGSLAAHLVPASFADAANDPVRLQETWSLERYDDFLVERSQLLARESTDFLHSLRSASGPERVPVS